jgi:hypothetical protein
MAELQQYKKGYYLWRYVPSLAAAALFVLLFLAITVAHFWRLFRTRMWFCLPFAIGGFCKSTNRCDENLKAHRHKGEFIGYCARASAYSQTGKLMPYVIQNMFILLPPALFAASIYMTLGRIIRSVRGEIYSIIRVDWLTKLFILGDVLAFMVQGSAAGLMVTGNNATLGERIVVAGLLIQVIMFGLFAVTAIIFHVRFQRYSVGAIAYGEEIPWKQSLIILYAVSALIMVRSIFRVAEYVMGQDGYPLNNEWTLYVFDSVLMLVVMVIFFIWYPSRLRPATSDTTRLELTEDERKR